MFDEHAVAVRRDKRSLVTFTRDFKVLRHDYRYLSQIKGQSFEERPCTYIFEGKQNHI